MFNFRSIKNISFRTPLPVGAAAARRTYGMLKASAQRSGSCRDDRLRESQRQTRLEEEKYMHLNINRIRINNSRFFFPPIHHAIVGSWYPTLSFLLDRYTWKISPLRR